MGEDKSVTDIVNEAERLVNRVLNNNIQPEKCPIKKQKAEW
jgi:hypothetical protein